ncbi:MAG: hypothetical protein IT562_03510 [Alphaproteobacteria bacterium]|nr:hypothetical protein [Alphaproteobacteria bacterium]
MALRIDTFSNQTGGNALFKALGHPIGAERLQALIHRLAGLGPVAIYDPLGFLSTMASLHDLSALKTAGVYVQDLADLGQTRLGHPTQPVTDIGASSARAVLVAAFDAQRLVDHIRHLLPPDATVATLDDARLPDALLTNRQRYLDPLNFATNFAFFRDQGGLHTRLATANYWSGYGARDVSLWLALFDAAGTRIATWTETVPDGIAGIAIDSRDVRRRFGLPEFAGQVLVHVVNGRGHDVVKYALDTYGDPGLANGAASLSCTHDANAWPSNLYAGLPAPRADERVVLWVQNSHCCPIPKGAIGLNLMGDDHVAWLGEPVPAFASRELDVASLLPGARWPQQIEIQAGKHFVRPRYEVIETKAPHAGRRRIAHPNVEREDLKPDPRIAELGNLMGKGYLLPAPVLPVSRWRSIALPTPMATCQKELPIAAIVYDREGREQARHRFGRLKRRDSVAIDAETLLDGAALGAPGADWGHMELIYDLEGGGEADGWLHGLFRYEAKSTGHAAETSFGAHVFNTVLTYRNEPQSYAGRAPGLSTRLYLRLGPPPLDTLCHLIYPASTPWHGRSATELALHDRAGREVTRRPVAIPCGGSLLWRYSEQFGQADRARAGEGAYVIVRDTTCRLFGYHGLIDDQDRFSLDHMFGF